MMDNVDFLHISKHNSRSEYVWGSLEGYRKKNQKK